ncbi:DNA-binding MarR family transcriptional regulator/N-acetylglutamate synthase-like GNAT family acetyltransferase [Anaerosolibacter carboniphilus]|uniref:DNA-binding MarR family transcriptional regulator/N-acetylglutamate synthase-like GNAT family acetyltransferase n=1 Tax=Anaerosolibacter carboniphilus TaxID=1417629 RepID=A0A841L317_9FIRM|nr:helix-turn-helix domain-containing GNAT family N-acetyltransferase [Anaerosolibacter carboniphilus]MBB6219028.1 DNA-binding MarR family transcriptional regulator/N-acetylglutamate synthase-like GNAT family acetyltransferase [Anaerosolibacter carboniphilus]
MGAEDKSVVQALRSFNRFYTDILGLLNQHILDSPYSLTEVRVLFEIDKTEDCTANILMEKLNIDRGYMSRLLKRFEAKGFIRKENSIDDGRTFLLHLTPLGKETLVVLEQRSEDQILGLIKDLAEDEQEKLVKSMRYIKRTLLGSLNAVRIRAFQPEDIGYVVKRHRDLYESEYKFSAAFADYVEKAVSKFSECYDKEKENMWIAEVNGVPVGVIAVVRVDESTAQLRWFLMEPQMRGIGLGHKLMKTAMDFCKEKNYKHVFLWTVSILEAARHLYKVYGFKPTETHENDTWTERPIIEERWDLYL